MLPRKTQKRIINSGVKEYQKQRGCHVGRGDSTSSTHGRDARCQASTVAAASSVATTTTTAIVVPGATPALLVMAAVAVAALVAATRARVTAIAATGAVPSTAAAAVAIAAIAAAWASRLLRGGRRRPRERGDWAVAGATLRGRHR